ncbi:hypothetical protein WIV_gp025 [Wiseana iridescent virus]|uniref:Uncharacterized protein n=1 Tax=Wiseana iridescent virus TaxID=68347 RepID=G0T551_IRV9|nr:hypothetical protein WIV_gp025 [Wiseana iridescent virus]ADO00368.1 hypothetical protein [Wiseana iridescent virus]
MFECTYCDLTFETKSLWCAHQKTKKCTVHRNIGFVCRKCFLSIKGYDNALKHTLECNENIEDDLSMITSLLKSLSTTLTFNIVYNENNEGVINFKKVCNYTHPTKLECGVSVPLKMFLFTKTLNRYTDPQLLGSHHSYISDINSKIVRISDTFQFMSVKYGFVELLNISFLQSKVQSCFTIKDGTTYILGKVQCQNTDNQKWFGDTFNLKEKETIVKCIWYRDPDLKQFFVCLKPLLKDILNLYLQLGNWCCKQKKIKLYTKSSSENISQKYKIISEVMAESNFTNLIDNIQKLEDYNTFYTTFTSLLKNLPPLQVYTNIQHVFKDDLLPSPTGFEEFSLMCMNNPEYSGKNYDCLMDYILPQSEKLIFRSKE